MDVVKELKYFVFIKVSCLHEVDVVSVYVVIVDYSGM